MLQWRPPTPSPKNMSIFDVKNEPFKNIFSTVRSVACVLVFHALSRSCFGSPTRSVCFVPLPLYTLPALSLLENETKLGTKKIVKLKLLENELNYFLNQKKPTLTLCFFSTLIWKQSRNVDIKLKTAFQSDANSSSRYQ